MQDRTELSDCTVVARLKRLAEEDPNKEAFLFVDKYHITISLSRKDVWDRSRKFAAILKRHGVEKGDIVCNTLVNSPERLITALGTITAGAISMQGQMLLANGDDLIHNMGISECKALIVDESKSAFLDRISYEDEKTGSTCYQDLPHLKIVLKLRVYRGEKDADSSSLWFCSLGNEQEMFEEDDIRSEDVAFIFNTSGTLGFSKLVPYTHRLLIVTSISLLNCWETEAEDVFYSNRSLGWPGGFPHGYTILGNKYVLTDHAHGVPEDMASHMIYIFEKEICHYGNLAVTELERILGKLEIPLPHLFKTVLTGGGPVATFIEKAIGNVTNNIFIGYGGAEFGFVSAMLLDRDSLYEDYCTGNIVRGVEVKILDEKSEHVSMGQQGEIYVRSPMIANHYIKNPEKVKESFLEDGWFRTGDMGYQDGKGYLFVLGRKANTVMKGSFVLYTGWLEAKILKCPGIKSISIIGVPDPILYEEVCLCIVKAAGGNLTEDTIKEFCQNLFQGSDKDEIVPIPKYYLFFEEFPLNLNMKIDRRSLKAEACQRLGIKI